MGIGIAIYSLNVYNSEAKHANLFNVHEGKDIFQLISEFLSEKSKEFYKIQGKEMVTKCEDWEIVVQYDGECGETGEEQPILKYIYGRIKTGDYGIESEIVDTETGETRYQMRDHEARVMPFDFMIATPTDVNDQALVVLETQGIYGIKTQLEYALKSYLQKLNPCLALSFGKVIPKAYFNKYIDTGELKKIKLYRYNIPNNMVNAYYITPSDKRKVEERIISSPAGFSPELLKKVKECLAAQRAYYEIIEIPEFEIDDLKLEFKLGKRTKTMSIKNIEQLVLTEDISEEVETKGGNPTKESMKKVMLDNVEQFEVQMGNYEIVETRHEIVIEAMSNQEVEENVS